jgi:ABC-2 type transporter.
MKALNVFLVEMKKTLSNIKLYIFLYFIAPFLISLLNGILYDKAFNPSRSIPKFTAAIVDLDKGSYSDSLYELFKDPAISKLIDIKSNMNLDEAEEQVKNGDVCAAIVIPDGFSDSIKNSTGTSIKVIKSLSADIQAGIVESIMNAYTDNLNTVNSLNISAYKNITDKNEASAVLSKIQPELSSILSSNYIDEVTLNKSKELSSKQFYSQSMLVMFSLFLISVGGSFILIDKENGTSLRIKSTATSKASYIAGKLSWTFILSFMEISVFIILTGLINKINWGENITGLFVVVLSHCLLITGLSALMGSIFKTQKSMNNIFTVILMVMALLGGSFYPSDLYPSFLKTISHFTLHYHLQSEYSGIMLGKPLSGIGLNLMFSIITAAAGLIIGYLKFHFDKSEVA